MNPEGVSYQYEFERFTTDERTQNIRLSSSLNDFRSARIPGNNLLKNVSLQQLHRFWTIEDFSELFYILHTVQH